MRILFSSYPLYGHLLPMLPLARAARRLGHEVAIATGGSLASRISQIGARDGIEVWQVEPTDHAPQGGGSWIPGAPADVSARARAPELVRRTEAWKPGIVIHEPLDYAAPIAAAWSGARPFVHGLGPIVPASVHAYLLPGLQALFAEWKLPEPTALFSTPYLDICPPALRQAGPALWTNPRPLRPGAIEIGVDGSLPHDLAPRLAALPYPRSIHFTLGTVVNDDLSVFSSVLDGLQTIEANVVVTVGPGIDPSPLLPQPQHVLIEQFVPHGLLLPHCDLVINQGGNGSVLAALIHGLPLLLLPRGADQFLTAAACARAGVALVLRPAHVTSANIRRAVTHVLNAPYAANAARRLQAEIAEMPAPEAVIGSILRGGPVEAG